MSTQISIRGEANSRERVADVEMTAVLRNVWHRHEEQVETRLDFMQRALEALETDTLDPETRMQGVRAAHVLAGSVGMFGFMAASTSARMIERELEHPRPSHAHAMIALLGQMRAELAQGM